MEPSLGARGRLAAQEALFFVDGGPCAFRSCTPCALGRGVLKGATPRCGPGRSALAALRLFFQGGMQPGR